MPPTPYRAFTVKSSGHADRIMTRVGVRAAIDPTNPPSQLPPAIDAVALWDTGASRSVIAGDLATHLGLTAVGATMVNHADGQTKSLTHLVNFDLPNRVGVAGVLVTEFKAPPDFKVLIGMDIIGLGDFSITNYQGRTCMSFRVPSVKEIDYVVEANRIAWATVGRNQPCPCGKKNDKGEPVLFKFCHKPLLE